jgi:hypothetical protein
MVGDPVSESQGGGLEDVEERAFQPKVPKPPNRTALAANRVRLVLLKFAVLEVLDQVVSGRAYTIALTFPGD